jgi:hypothetical protein
MKVSLNARETLATSKPHAVMMQTFIGDLTVPSVLPGRRIIAVKHEESTRQRERALQRRQVLDKFVVRVKPRALATLGTKTAHLNIHSENHLGPANTKGGQHRLHDPPYPITRGGARITSTTTARYRRK